MKPVYTVFVAAALLFEPMSALNTREKESRRQLGILAMLGEALIPLFAGAGEVAAGAAIDAGIGAGLGAAIDTGAGALIDTAVGAGVDTVVDGGVATVLKPGVTTLTQGLAQGLKNGIVDAVLKAAVLAGTAVQAESYFSHGQCLVGAGYCRIMCIPLLEQNIFSKIDPGACPTGTKCCSVKPPKPSYTTTTASASG